MGFAMHQYIILLSDLSYEHGLIGIAEYRERREVAYWLSVDEQGQQDPRDSPHEEPGRLREFDEERGDNRGGSGSGNDPEEDPTDQWPRFLALNKWMFTAGDRDCYPSVPHGHLHRKTNEWPKLNPYTGRVFSAVHAEFVPRRLTKAEMKILWSDSDFVEHCRKQVHWYSDFAPNYGFPNARFGKYRFPKW